MPNKLDNNELLIDCDTISHSECPSQRIWGVNKQGICSCLSPHDYIEKPQHPDLNGVYLIVINGCGEEYKNLFGNTKNGQSSLHPRFMSRSQVKFNCSPDYLNKEDPFYSLNCKNSDLNTKGSKNIFKPFEGIYNKEISPLTSSDFIKLKMMQGFEVKIVDIFDIIEQYDCNNPLPSDDKVSNTLKEWLHWYNDKGIEEDSEIHHSKNGSLDYVLLLGSFKYSKGNFIPSFTWKGTYTDYPYTFKNDWKNPQFFIGRVTGIKDDLNINNDSYSYSEWFQKIIAYQTLMYPDAPVQQYEYKIKDSNYLQKITYVNTIDYFKPTYINYSYLNSFEFYKDNNNIVYPFDEYWEEENSNEKNVLTGIDFNYEFDITDVEKAMFRESGLIFYMGNENIENKHIPCKNGICPVAFLFTNMPASEFLVSDFQYNLNDDYSLHSPGGFTSVVVPLGETNHNYNKILVDGILEYISTNQSGGFSLGEILYAGKLYLFKMMGELAPEIVKDYYYNFNIIGDSSLPLWVNEPKSIEVNRNNVKMAKSSDFVKNKFDIYIKDENNKPLSGVNVSIVAYLGLKKYDDTQNLKNNYKRNWALLGKGVTESNGRASIYFDIITKDRPEETDWINKMCPALGMGADKLECSLAEGYRAIYLSKDGYFLTKVYDDLYLNDISNSSSFILKSLDSGKVDCSPGMNSLDCMIDGVCSDALCSDDNIIDGYYDTRSTACYGDLNCAGCPDPCAANYVEGSDSCKIWGYDGCMPTNSTGDPHCGGCNFCNHKWGCCHYDISYGQTPGEKCQIPSIYIMEIFNDE